MYKLTKIQPSEKIGTMPQPWYILEENGKVIYNTVMIENVNQKSTINMPYMLGLGNRVSELKVPTGMIEIYNMEVTATTSTQQFMYPVMIIPSNLIVIQ